MDLEATAALFGAKLRDLGGKLTSVKPYWRNFGAKFGHLGPCQGIWKLQLCFLGQSWGILRASWAIGRSGYVIFCYVEAICQILFGHVVGFASRNALPPAGPKF